MIPKLKALAVQYPQIYHEITGRGLLIGMHFNNAEIGYKVAAGLFKRGVLVAGTLTSAQTSAYRAATGDHIRANR